MTHSSPFFTSTDLEPARLQPILGDALRDADDGELFLEYCQSESVAFDDGKLRESSFDISQGFGLRAVRGESTAYAHSCELTEAAIKRAAETVKGVHHGQEAVPGLSNAPFGTNQKLYTEVNPLEELPFGEKVTLLGEIDAYLRAKDPRVRQVSASLSGEWQLVHILRADGRAASDIRPLVRLNIGVFVEENGRMERGSYGCGGRRGYADYITPEAWKAGADEALRQALVNLQARPAPAGEMPVVLGPGWCGVLLHEAVGHGLEGDFNRKQTSAFSGLMGKRVAAPGVTVVDDGTMTERRGSLTIDDEGTPTARNILIEDGILKGYMQDRLNARLMGAKATGNGRRESYAHAPMPRMTNTFMLGGQEDPQDIIASVKNGIYATHFGGGQVDITSGKFVFSATEAYKIENGKIAYPIKGATLIGNGPDCLTKIRAIGNDMALDNGIGTCGKDGQSVPAGVGQPTMLIEPLTVGGTEA